MPPQTSRHPHLFLPGPSTTRDDYTSPRQGGGGATLKQQHRESHAGAIIQGLEKAEAETLQRKATAQSTREGTYIEFSSEPGFDLVLKSLESQQAGIRLLNVRTTGSDSDAITRATVFVPQDKNAYFLDKAKVYLAEDNPPKPDGTSTPKNGPLIESIAEVKAAILQRSFWNDELDLLPSESPKWIEAWISSEDVEDIAHFKELCETQRIIVGEGQCHFPERTVLLLQANRIQLESLIEHSALIAEFRSAREVATFFIEQNNTDQTSWANHLLDRTSFDQSKDISVLVLDHGVNNGHMLLEPLLADDDCHANNPEWGTQDDHGHGTLMAGTAAYGDIQEKLEQHNPLIIEHILESSKILPPPPEVNPRRLWGYQTAEGIYRAEIQAPQRKRIICMAITSKEGLKQGRPSSWSGQIDRLAAGVEDERQRLIILSAGNVDDPEEWKNYPDANLTAQVQDPAQAWNALTVGAYTTKTRISDPFLNGYSPVADSGGLSPFSSSSLTWPERKWPIKPEILFEGGNVAKNSSNAVFPTDDLALLSTYHLPGESLFSAFNATSIASAQAAHMAAQLQAVYSDSWPETIRGLMVHSANWTETQIRNHLSGRTKADYQRLARVCGYGVPNLQTAISCGQNSLSLIAEAEIQPFTKHATDSRGITKDMHIYSLPWPETELLDLGELEIQMRVTLSYFIELSPGEIGWQDRYRYASHALRFELNGPGENQDRFIQRINRKARDDDQHPGSEGAGSHWTLGESRNVGSIHSDIWTGTAAQLAASNLIAVHPAVGWWKERRHLGNLEKSTRYSLIISFTLPSQEIDIYTPIAQQLGIKTPIEVSIPT